MSNHPRNAARRPGCAPRGRPFQPGLDPRRNTAGQRSKRAVAFSKALRELIIAEGEQKQTGEAGDKVLRLKKIDWLVKKLWNAAMQGESWAVALIFERTEGKVTQPVDAKVQGQVTFIMPRPGQGQAPAAEEKEK